MTRVVCQVLHRPGRVSFIWSDGAASFEPYHLEHEEVETFYQAARLARSQLARLVQGADSSVAFDLAGAGHKLFRSIFRHDRQDPAARGIWNWLNNLRDRNEISSLDMLGDVPGQIPWNVVCDQPPDGQTSEVSKNSEVTKAFWGRQFALAVGKRVNPLRVACVLDSPTILLVADPYLLNGLPESERNLLADWAAAHQLQVLDSVTDLRDSILAEAPDVLYILAGVHHGALRIGGEDLTLSQLRDYLAAAREGNLDPVVFLQASADPSEWESWECFLAGAVNTLSGIVTSEVPLTPVLANRLGIEALARFVQSQRLGEALKGARAGQPVAGLAYSVFCPSHVKIAGDNNTDPDIQAPEQIPLPDYPYRPWVPYESEDRGLFAGREDDTVRCAGLLDEAASRGLVIHGAGGAGKSSFVRAGLLPHLETETVGFLALRDRTPESAEQTSVVSKTSEVYGASDEKAYPVVAIRPGLDLLGQIAEALCAFCAQPFAYISPTGERITVDLPKILESELGGVSKTAPSAEMLESTAAPSSQGDANQTTAADLAHALAAESDRLARLLDQVTRRLPFEIVMVIEDAEDFVLHEGKGPSRRRRQALEALAGVLRSRALCKVILVARTEYLGRLMDYLTLGHERWRTFFLDELPEEQMLSAILLPTETQPVPYSSDIPAQKYGFSFEPGVAGQLVKDALKVAAIDQRSPMPLLQVLCGDLYDRAKKRDVAVIAAGERKAQGPVDKFLVRSVDEKLKNLPVTPAERQGLRKIMEQLSKRHTDGTVTRELVPLSKIAAAWKGASLENVVDAAAQEGLIEANPLLVGGRPDIFLSLPQDALAQTAVQWHEQRKLRAFGRTRIVDTLWIMIPMLFLVAAITWTVTRRSAPPVESEENTGLAAEVGKMQIQVEALRWPAYVGDIIRAEQAWNTDNPLLTRQILLAQQAVKNTDLRDFEWFYLWNKVQGRGFEGTGQKGIITRVAMSPDGAMAASASLDGTVKLWDLAKMEEVGTLQGHTGPVFAVAFSADGKNIATGGADKSVRIWDVDPSKEKTSVITREQKTLVGHAGAVHALVYGPRELFSAGADKQVITWDPAGGKTLNIFKEHKNAVQALAVAPDGKMVASADADGVILMHDDAKTLQTLKAPGPVMALAFARDGKTLASGDHEKQDGREQGMIRFWDPGTGKETRAPLQHGPEVFALAFLPDGKQLASAGKDNLLRIWEVSSGRQVAAHKGHLGWITTFAVAGDGSSMVSSGADGTIRIWGALPPDSLTAHEGPVHAVVFTPDDKVLVTAGKDGTIKFWDTSTGKLLTKLTGLGNLSSMAISEREKVFQLAAGISGDKADGSIRLWNLAWDVKEGLNAKELAPLKGHTKGVTCLAFAADGKTLASGSVDQTAILWDMESGKQKVVFKGNDSAIRCLAFPSEPPYTLITGGDDGKIRQWASDTGRESRSHQAHSGAVHAVAYFYGFVGFATAGEDGSTKFWIWPPDKEAEAIHNHRSNTQAVTSLAISPNRHFIAGGSLDQGVKLFNTQIEGNAAIRYFGRERFTFTQMKSPVRSLAVSTNSQTLTAGGEDGIVRFWRAGVR